MNANDPKSQPLPITNEPVPVFDCHVLLSQTDKGYAARAANLDGVTATGPTERDALRAISKAFKTRVEAHVAAGESIPFLTESMTPNDDEVERWIPVHL
ncbi:MAG: hypothetical protein AB8G99_05610 [Planctomycetaceae bacterium]